MLTINVIINTLTLGFFWMIVGVEENDRTKKIWGAIAVLISVVLNGLSMVKVI